MLGLPRSRLMKGAAAGAAVARFLRLGAVGTVLGLAAGAWITYRYTRPEGLPPRRA